MSNEKPLPPMPPARGRYREVWVGLFVIAGIAAVLTVLFTMTNAALFRGRYIVSTTVPDASGIRRGDPVQMRGVNIGRILGFRIRQHEVDIRLEIEGEYPIPKDSRVELRSAGLMGGMFADVVPGSSTENVPRNGHLPGGTGPGLFDKVDALAGQADKVAVRVQNLLDQQTVDDVKGTAADARQSFAQLQAMLKEQRGELRALSKSLRSSAESLQKVTSGPELERSVKRIDQLTQRLETTSATVDRSSTALESILGRIDRGEGTLGKLSRDDKLYEQAREVTANLNKTTVELQKLIADVQAHPRKYINLKIF